MARSGGAGFRRLVAGLARRQGAGGAGGQAEPRHLVALASVNRPTSVAVARPKPRRRLARRLARFIGFVDPVTVRTPPKVESVVVGQLRLGRDVEGLRAEVVELRARVEGLEREGAAPRPPRPRQHPPEHGRALGRRAGTLEVEPPAGARVAAGGGPGRAD